MRVAQDALGIPGVSVHLSPAILRSVLKPARTPPLPVSARLPRSWNRLVYSIVDALLIDRALAGPLNDFRRSLGLPPVKRIFNSWIHSPDRVIGLFPDWFAPQPPDWPRQTVLTGFPLYDESDVTAVDPAVERFLIDGPAPIAFTPGSAMRHAQRFFAEAVRTCRILGCRGVLLSRHAENMPANLPPDVRHVDYVPFSRLLPHCAALVHHGGIGTAAQALAAGIPQLVVPMAHDQPDNAARLNRLGVAEVLPARRFRAPRASAALKLAMDQSLLRGVPVDQRAPGNRESPGENRGDHRTNFCREIGLISKPHGAALAACGKSPARSMRRGFGSGSRRRNDEYSLKYAEFRQRRARAKDASSDRATFAAGC